MDAPDADRNRVAAVTAATVGIAAVDAVCAVRSTAAPSEPPPASQPVQAIAAVTIHAPVNDVYRRWEGFRNLPRFMSDFASVQIVNDRRSHWRVTGPGGIALEWDVEITNVTPNERIAWRGRRFVLARLRPGAVSAGAARTGNRSHLRRGCSRPAATSARRPPAFSPAPSA